MVWSQELLLRHLVSMTDNMDRWGEKCWWSQLSWGFPSAGGNYGFNCVYYQVKYRAKYIRNHSGYCTLVTRSRNLFIWYRKWGFFWAAEWESSTLYLCCQYHSPDHWWLPVKQTQSFVFCSTTTHKRKHQWWQSEGCPCRYSTKCKSSWSSSSKWQPQ
jgi:hypothetical protein